MVDLEFESRGYDDQPGSAHPVVELLPGMLSNGPVRRSPYFSQFLLQNLFWKEHEADLLIFTLIIGLVRRG